MKALWALEPFHQDSARNKGMHRLLSQLAGSPDKVEAGFVVTRGEAELNLAFDIPERDRFTVYPRSIIKQTLKKSGLEINDRRIHVVDYATLSTTKAVDRLLKLAGERDAELIGLFTHSRKGFSRLLLGSFAETAIHRSAVSLLVASPLAKISPKIKNVFFASDFSSKSMTQLKRVLRLCEALGAKLTVFHAAEPIYKWSLDESDSSVQRYRKGVDAMKKAVADEARKFHVTVNVVVASEFKSTSDMAVKAAQKARADLVVVTAKTGRLAALMGGSVTRQIVRQSSVPVMVLK